MQGQFGTGQIQGKRIVIGVQFGPTARGHAHTRAVRSDHAQAVPAMRINKRPSQRQQGHIELPEHLSGKAATHLREGAIAAFAHASGKAVRLGNHFVECGLHRGTHAGQHHRQYARHGEFALPGERAGPQPERLDERGIVQA